MAHKPSALARSCATKRMSAPISSSGAKKRRQASLLLYFPLDAKALRTPFRASVLQSIYEIARKELGSRMVSAGVEAAVDPDDPGRVSLLLSIWANVTGQDWNAVDAAIGQTVFERQTAWTEDEKADYLRTIDFEILPLKV